MRRSPTWLMIVDRPVVRIVGQADDRIGRRWPAELVAGDEEAGDRAADQARDHKPERRDGDADFERVGEPEALSDDRRPGDRRAMAADERGRAEKGRDPLRQAERRDAAGGDQVLDDEIGKRQAEQHEKRAAAGNEVVELGVEADAGEEIEQEQVARLEREADLDPEPEIGDERQHGREQPAGHRLRNVPAPERRDEAIEAGAGEEHDDRDRERQQPGRLDRRHRLEPFAVASSRRAPSTMLRMVPLPDSRGGRRRRRASSPMEWGTGTARSAVEGASACFPPSA